MSKSKPITLTLGPNDYGSEITALFFLQTFQQLASLHATELGVSAERLAEDQLAWMLHRLKIRFHSWPCSDQVFEFESYPSGFFRMLATRDFIVRNQEGEIIVQATSAWLVANTMKRRAVPIPDWIQQCAPAYAPANLDLSNRRIVARKEALPTIAKLSVQETDIDFLNHVNNTRYSHWVLTHVPSTFMSDHELEELDILFKNEARLHDQLHIERFQDSNTFSHRIRNAKDQVELIQAKTRWRPRQKC